MNRIGDVIDLREVKRKREGTVLDSSTIKVINLIFREIVAYCPAYKQAWPTQEDFDRAKKSWTKVLIKEKVNTIEQVKLGIERLIKEGSPFVPTISQFLSWCKPTPESLGLPDVEQAYQEALRNSRVGEIKKWSHQAIYHAWSITNTHNLVNFSREKSFSLFKESYQKTAEALFRGEKLKEIKELLPEKSGVRSINSPVANKTISGLYAILR